MDVSQPLDELERMRLRDYLDAAHLLHLGRGLLVDQVNRAAPYIQVGFWTDGMYVWSTETAEYITRYGAVPDPEFLAHLRAVAPHQVIPPLTSEQEAEARAIMLQRGRFQ